jgi:hypothetical protein
LSTLAVILTLAVPAASADGSLRASDSELSSSSRVGGSQCPPNAKRVGKGCIPRSAARVNYGERCASARNAVVHYRALTWARQDAREGARADRTPVVRSKTCRWARYAADEWQARARSAKRTLERHLSLVSQHLTLRDFEVTSGNHAWLRAIEEAQKPYPNTAARLKSCSSTEGGWGRWVPNSDGFPPGGWMQMYESTFWRMWATAKADVTARGFRVPNSAASWYSPLGQALASAWGLTNGRRHEWSSRGC